MSLFSSADVAGFRTYRLAAVQGTYFPSTTFSDADLLGQIQAAEAEIGRLLKVRLEPTYVFPYQPTSAEITALGTMPYIEEPGYDYDTEFFRGDRWGYILTRQRPIISVDQIRFVYPAPTTQVYAIPSDWLRLDKKYGQIRMVPASSQFVAPLGAFLMQALAGGSQIPSMIQVKYTCGLTDAKNQWPDLINVIMKRAVQQILMGAMPEASASISADGLSQSRSLKLQDYEDQFQTAMYGPKGSNGGLWTAIHGIQMGVIGVTA